ncbi:MAG: glycine radical domain-containing protein, partial [Pseudomonadota bacterium]
TKFRNYLEATMDLGLDMVQFNVIDRDTLIAAQKQPENYQDLVVRVSGFNSHFVDLSKFVQDTVIERTEHAL